MQLVLHGGKEGLADRVGRVVVDAGGVDVRDLLVEQPLRGADVADALEQFVEVVSAQRAAFLEALVIQREAFDQQLGQARGGPLAKRGATGGADAVADGEDGVEVVVIDGARDLASALGLNYPETPNSCLGVELALVCKC